MAGLQVERIIGVGVSQGAVRIVAYHNGVHPLAAVFDGFMPLLHGAMLRTDLGIPAFKVLSETDVWRDQVPFRQPDSGHLRRWEVAGTAHLDFRVAQAFLPLQTREFGLLPQPACTAPPLSRIPLAFVLHAAFDHMAAWVKRGIEPPTGPDIDVDMSGAIVRDGFGNALGGIRLSQHAVPTAVNTGVNGPLTNACRVYGSYVPFDEETLAALYPDHQSYLAAAIEATHETQRDGFIVGADAAATIRDAARSNIGRR
jgi:hypothetical protein